jgi:hypothetical protein
VLRSAAVEDVGLRWCALYVAGDVGDASAGELLYRAAAQSLPEPCGEHEGCEGPRDAELVVRTMAIEALQRVAERHREVAELVLKLIGDQPEQPVLIEAVKAARALKLKGRAAELLRKKDRWMLEIETVPVNELVAEAERDDVSSHGLVPPGRRTAKERPVADCCMPRRED